MIIKQKLIHVYGGENHVCKCTFKSRDVSTCMKGNVGTKLSFSFLTGFLAGKYSQFVQNAIFTPLCIPLKLHLIAFNSSSLPAIYPIRYSHLPADLADFIMPSSGSSKLSFLDKHRCVYTGHSVI